MPLPDRRLRRDLDDAIQKAARLVTDLQELVRCVEGWRLLDPDAERDRVARSLDLYGFAARVCGLRDLLRGLRCGG